MKAMLAALLVGAALGMLLDAGLPVLRAEPHVTESVCHHEYDATGTGGYIERVQCTTRPGSFSTPSAYVFE